MYDGHLVNMFSRDNEEMIEAIPQMMAGLA